MSIIVQSRVAVQICSLKTKQSVFKYRISILKNDSHSLYLIKNYKLLVVRHIFL